MLVVDVLDTGTVSLPWPIAIGDRVFASKGVLPSPICDKRCGPTPKCAQISLSPGEKVCDFGVTFFREKIKDTEVTIYGVRGPNNPNASRRLKEALKGRFADRDGTKAWANSIETLMDAFENGFLQRQSELLDPLHDPIRLVSQIQTLAERLVEKEHPGLPLYEQIAQSSYEAKSILGAAGLLNDAFELLVIYFNPAAAAFGRKNRIQLYGLLRKLQAIFSIRPPENTGERTPRVHLDGHSYQDVEVYESFKVLPFALMSNAVKYSLGGDIRVRVADRPGIVETSIESRGPYIEPEEIGPIFERRKRGKWAESIADGTGVGLYLSAIVAAANNCKISVTSEKLNFDRDVKGVRIPVATNRFTFELPARTAAGARP